LWFRAEQAFAAGTSVVVVGDDPAVELAWGWFVGVPAVNLTEPVSLIDAVLCGEPVV
jgi:hypothetical protein